jgi:hypothetical protein
MRGTVEKISEMLLLFSYGSRKIGILYLDSVHDQGRVKTSGNWEVGNPVTKT